MQLTVLIGFVLYTQCVNVILETYSGKVWTECVWLRVRTTGGRYEHGSTKGGEFLTS
jgi:hypothetical protein